MGELLSQDLIDQLLNAGANSDANAGGNDNSNNDSNDTAPHIILQPEELDALGEVGNICMGTSATTLSTLLGPKVNITTPRVTVLSEDELQKQYTTPYVAVLIEYKEGLIGKNLMVLKLEDVKIITSLMMGNNGVIDPDEEINEIHLSAIGEAMNQMIGSSATSLSDMFLRKVDISPPKTFLINFQSDADKIKQDGFSDFFVKTSFQMQIGDLINSEIMQIMPIEFAKELTDILFGKFNDSPDAVEQKAEAPKESAPPAQPERKEEPPQAAAASTSTVESKPSYAYEQESRATRQVNIIQPRYDIFDNDSSDQPFDGNKEMLSEVPVDLTVELGKVRKKIKDLMEIGSGSLIPLNKVVGESLNVYANGKCIARGEVVIVDDSYAIRVTEVLKNK